MAQKSTKKKGPIAPLLQLRNSPLNRQDIADWKAAKQAAIRVDYPRMYLLQELYTNIMVDAHLSAQIQLRKAMPLGSDFDLVNASGDVDDQASARCAQLPAIRTLISLILDAQLFGYSIVELSPQPAEADPLAVTLIDRRHIDPVNGIALIYPYDTDGIHFRDLREYGSSILEFNVHGLGILDQAIPHVLYKRFAQACWSEFCEVCGMPPRYIKTNTQDPELRDAYLAILKDSGSGSNFLVDTDDEVGFIDTHASKGEAYENLIRICSNELSLLINGAVLGQDTQFGSNAKEQTSSDLNEKLVKADFDFVESAFNTTVLPALEALGFLPHGLRFRFRQQENVTVLFNQTMQAAQYFDIDPDWVKEKFGIEVLGPKTFSVPSQPPSSQKKKDDPNEDPDDDPDDDDKTHPNHKNNAYDPFV